MKILILGDVMGSSGVEHLKKNLNKIIEDKKIDFTIVNGENAAEDGKGITKDIAEKLLDIGVDVITSGNHIWDKSGIIDFIRSEPRLLRPQNLAAGSPGNGFGIFFSKETSIGLFWLLQEQEKMESDSINISVFIFVNFYQD